MQTKCQSETCGKPLKQTQGKREKRFCDSGCRSNQFVKDKRRLATGEGAISLPKDMVDLKNIKVVDKKGKVSKLKLPEKKKVLVRDLTKPNKQVKPITDPPAKSNYSTKPEARKPYMSDAIKKKLGL